jgi:hypothetical protein
MTDHDLILTHMDTAVYFYHQNDERAFFERRSMHRLFFAAPTASRMRPCWGALVKGHLPAAVSPLPD